MLISRIVIKTWCTRTCVSKDAPLFYRDLLSGEHHSIFTVSGCVKAPKTIEKVANDARICRSREDCYIA
jgi:hypothetical protein